ncbi:DUF1398 domain-containing protein [uncultured Fibrella sp.]|uniref:DUF1398 domain-containing protein n=1 Tax=uncultured Fibrella sp. TaxID=1284596 RepID=UPI0035CC132A
MFSINQIKEIHSKVKSGADFPAYVQELKALGVLSYSLYVSDGHTDYHGADRFTLHAEATWPLKPVASPGTTSALKHALLIHQKGQTDYPTFCDQAAEAGVEKWVVDLEKMTCVYLDKQGNELVLEVIPTA